MWCEVILQWRRDDPGRPRLPSSPQGSSTQPPVDLPVIAQDAPAKVPGITTVQKLAPMLLKAAEARPGSESRSSSDGSKIGSVVAFVRSADNLVNEMHADIGGFLGLGEIRVSLQPAQIRMQSDRVVLEVTAAQAKDLLKVLK